MNQFILSFFFFFFTPNIPTLYTLLEICAVINLWGSNGIISTRVMNFPVIFARCELPWIKRQWYITLQKREGEVRGTPLKKYSRLYYYEIVGYGWRLKKNWIVFFFLILFFERSLEYWKENDMKFIHVKRIEWKVSKIIFSQLKVDRGRNNGDVYLR